MNVHLRGAFLMTRAVQKHMIEAKWGRIVNLSSTSALGNRGQANYSTAKAGLQGFTKTLAIELGKFGVTANAIAPGFIQTEMTKATAERMGIPFEDFIKGAASQIPVGAGRPAGGHRAPGVVLRQRGRRLRVRPGRLRRRRAEGLSAPSSPRGPGGHWPPGPRVRSGPEGGPVSDEVLVERRGAVQVITINRPAGAQRPRRRGRPRGRRRGGRARRLRRAAGRRAHRGGRLLLRRHGPQGVPARRDAGHRGPRAVRHHDHAAAQAADRRGRGLGAGRRVRAGARLRPRRRRADGAVRRARGEAVAGRRRRGARSCCRSGCRGRSRWRCC